MPAVPDAGRLARTEDPLGGP